MTAANFQPIFDYIDKTAADLEAKLRVDMATKTDIQKVLDAIDAFAKASKDNKQESLVLKAKAEKIEHWVMKAAETIDVPYRP